MNPDKVKFLGGATGIWDAKVESGTVTFTVTIDLTGIPLEWDHWDWVDNPDHRDGDDPSYMPHLTPEGLEFVLHECWLGHELEMSEPEIHGFGIHLEYAGE